MVAPIWLSLVSLHGLLSPRLQATTEEVHAAYINHARVFHPDKAQFLDSNPQDRLIPDGIDATSIFSLIAHAYAELEDPVKRSLYDMVMGFKSRDEAALQKMSMLKREEAKRSIELMQVCARFTPSCGGTSFSCICFSGLPKA